MSPLRQQLLDATRQRGFSHKTFTSYANAVSQLLRFAQRSADKLEPADLQAFFTHLVKDRQLAPSTCQSYWHGVHFFYEHVIGWAAADLPVVVPKCPQRIPELLTRADIRRLMRACDNLKHRTLLECGYGCGLRVSELVSLRVRHLDGERHLLRVEQGKGAKDRSVILSDALLARLREYWRAYRPDPWLFAGQRPERHLCISSAQRVFMAARARAGIEKLGGIHALRHAYATHQLEAGTPVHQLQRLLGHRSIQSTLRYVHWVPDSRPGPRGAVDLIAELEPGDE